MGILNKAEAFSFEVRLVKTGTDTRLLYLPDMTLINRILNPNYEKKCLDACDTCELKIRKVGNVQVCSGLKYEKKDLSAHLQGSINQSPRIDMESMKAKCLNYVK